MNTDDYRKECLRLLGDETYYALIPRDPTPKLQTQIRVMISEASNNEWITPKEASFLDATNPDIYMHPSAAASDGCSEVWPTCVDCTNEEHKAPAVTRPDLTTPRNPDFLKAKMGSWLRCKRPEAEM
ncbi:hypothetical protein NDU88_002808 [Pleurodeles waltl]|uniref:Uncharacterized protein n=1 Tax=Pleurodeles waltl TaxID=8319 RepID=A0AAV7P7U3_PLEWA|nr:hypothetical protein NDU88_002808 [Pleurodeles waltl]